MIKSKKGETLFSWSICLGGAHPLPALDCTLEVAVTDVTFGETAVTSHSLDRITGQGAERWHYFSCRDEDGGWGHHSTGVRGNTAKTRNSKSQSESFLCTVWATWAKGSHIVLQSLLFRTVCQHQLMWFLTFISDVMILLYTTLSREKQIQRHSTP